MIAITICSAMAYDSKIGDANPGTAVQSNIPDASSVMPSNCHVEKMYNENVGIMACETEAGVTHTVIHSVDSEVLL